MLAWFDEDREVATRICETIRSGLIRIFVSNRCSDAEKLADQTLDRAAKGSSAIASTYEGDPAKYCYGIARNIIQTDVAPEAPVILISHDDAYECLIECLEALTFEKQKLIFDYDQFQGEARIEHQRQMANELSITEGALRTRAHQIRLSLEKCILQCMSGVNAKSRGARGNYK